MRLLPFLAWVVCAFEPDEFWPPEGSSIELFPDLGNLSFPINASKLTQQYFDQGFRLLSAFDFRRAVLSFRAAGRASSKSCVLCLWGEALALGPNLNSFDEPRLLASVPLAFQRAQDAFAALEPQGSELESSLVLALKQRYLPTTADYVLHESTLTETYASELEQLLSKMKTTDANYANVAALTADALMNRNPWDYWVGRPKQLRSSALKAKRILEKALSVAPSHAFCIHLLVHITEASGNLTLLEEVRPLAELLPTLMPGAPHLIHMSFHTLMHTGDFHRADGDNTRASSLPRQIYPMHNLDTLSWACRIQGRSQCALDGAKSLEHLALPLVGSGFFETGFPPGRFAAVLPLSLVAFGRYGELWVRARPKECELDAFLAGIWHFARGCAAAHLGRRREAKKELQLLRQKRNQVEDEMSHSAGFAWKNFNGSKAWAVYPAGQLLQLADHELRARLENDLAAWQAAQQLENALPYDEPPSWYLPVANRFGEALQEAGRLEEARLIYQQSLSHLPNNGWALMGLWQLCRRLRPPEACDVLHRNFAKAWRHADVSLKNSAEVQDPDYGSSMWVRWPVKVLPWLSLGSLVFLALQIKGHGGACYHRMEG